MEHTNQDGQGLMEDMQHSFLEEPVTHLLQAHHQESLRSVEHSTEEGGYFGGPPTYTIRTHALYEDQHSPIEQTSKAFNEGNRDKITT